MRIPRPVKVAIVTLLLSYAAIVAWVAILQRRLIYFPDRDVPAPASVGLPDAEGIAFSAADGTALHGWLLRPPTPTANGLGALLMHGNAGNLASRALELEAFAHEGFATLLFDWRGFGRSSGSPSEVGLYADARAALDALCERARLDAGRVVYVGTSLGGGPAVQLATERPPAALVLVTPFTSLADVAARVYPWLPVRALLADRYDNAAKIGRVRAPVAVYAAGEDEVVPLDLARRLFDAAPEPKIMEIIAHARHNDCFAASPRAFLGFVRKALAARR